MGNRGDAKKTFGERINKKVPQYGNFGGPDYCHGEWVYDKDSKLYTWTQWADPIDGQDDIYLEHDKAYDLAEKQYANGEISSEEQYIMKMKADIQLVTSLLQYNPYTDPRCLAKEFAQMYQILATTAFIDKLLWDTTYGHEIAILKELFDLAREAFIIQRRDPLIIDLDGDGVETIASGDGAFFDHDGNGFAEQTGWAASDDGLLVRDINGNGTIDSGKELFGDQTILSNGQKAANGFAALADLDDNHDGKIDASDVAYSQLRVWQDEDGDGLSLPDELHSLEELGIQSINVNSTPTGEPDANGNTQTRIGSFQKADNTTGQIGSYNLQRDTIYTIAEEWLDVPEDIVVALPDLPGSGNVYDLQQAIVRDTSGQLKSLVEQFIAEIDVNTRKNILNQIIFKWAGTDGIAVNSRGGAIDARKLAALEKFFGQGFVGVMVPNPHGLAAVPLN